MIEKLKDITVLFVDDEELQRETMERILGRRFKKVILARDGVEALGIYKQDDSIDIIITDCTMPNMSGCELIDEVLKINPEQQIFILSGDIKINLEVDWDCSGVHYFKKPFHKKNDLEYIVKTLFPED
ncbi:MAG: response regulator [Campylobacterales bacterium]|nr:response regulator [Campylobacterales bacterium]